MKKLMKWAPIAQTIVGAGGIVYGLVIESLLFVILGFAVLNNASIMSLQDKLNEKCKCKQLNKQ